MADFTCQHCGNAFSLPQRVIDRYPGWSPKTCRTCRDGGAGRGRASDSRGGGGRRGRSLQEENLTLAAVLEKYTDGPQDGAFTDGSAHPNPGPGGWGAVFVVEGQVVDQAFGHEAMTTNNRMELTALIEGYELVPEGTPTTLYSDSRLVIDTLTKWAEGWEARGWRRKTGEVQNLDLVKIAYAKAKARPEIRLAWIAAHSGARWNEYADSLATAYLREDL